MAALIEYASKQEALHVFEIVQMYNRKSDLAVKVKFRCFNRFIDLDIIRS